MSRHKLTRRQEEALRRQEEKFEEAKAEIDDLGFVLQGSVVERQMECGKPACRCHEDPEARHGPYYQWTWKADGKTRAVYLTKEQAALCKKWSMNNRRLNKIISRLRSISLRAARSYEIRK
jgi:hypothetical protein